MKWQKPEKLLGKKMQGASRRDVDLDVDIKSPEDVYSLTGEHMKPMYMQRKKQQQATRHPRRDEANQIRHFIDELHQQDEEKLHQRTWLDKGMIGFLTFMGAAILIVLGIIALIVFTLASSPF